jgi:Tfp pilus assembly protein PilE
LIHELLLVLLVVEVLALITIAKLTVYTQSSSIMQHTYIHAIMHKQTRAMIRIVHQQRKNMFKKIIILSYMSL